MPLPPWAIARATRVIAQVPELDRKLVDRGASIRALAAMFRDSGSGGRTQSTRPGTYRPVRTRAGSGELRALLAHVRDPHVTAVSLVPAGRTRTPDMVVRYRPDTGRDVERVEVTSVTGAPAARQPFGRGGIGPVMPGDIAAAVVRKARRGQLTSRLHTPAMGAVPASGTIDVVVPNVPRQILGRAAGLAIRTLMREGNPGVGRIILRPAGARPVVYRLPPTGSTRRPLRRPTTPLR